MRGKTASKDDSELSSAPTSPVSLSQLAWLFLKLGSISFGGPAAHIAMMDEEIVRRRRWLTTDEFLDLLGATNLIPGPNSTTIALLATSLILLVRYRLNSVWLVVGGALIGVTGSLIK